MNTIRWLALAAVALLATLARPQSQASHQPGNQETADAAWFQLIASMEKMHGEMAATESSGDTDSDFVRLMLPHHQAALDMAKTQLLYGKDPQIRRLAQEIVTDQQSEIELMQLWLKQHPSSSSKPSPSPALHANKEHTK